jgi:uncharacterized membrane protein YraQ (UPF0718 family)/copper chaperone CopZ
MVLDILLNIVKETWAFTLIVSPWLILGFVVSGLIHAFIGEKFIRQHLGGGGFSPVLKATLFGIPLPICSCGVIPLAAGIRNDGASKAATMAFLVSTPTTGIDSIFVTYAFLGTAFAIVRPIAALVGGLFVGLLVSLAIKEKTQKREFASGPEHHHSLGQRLKDGLGYGFGVLPEDIGKTIFWGVLIGGVLSGLLPTDISQQYLSNPLIAYPLMLVISVPLYVCAVASVPIAAAMMSKGLVPGAALAFLIAGTATNTVTIAFVVKKFGKKVLFIYLAAIVVLALVFGGVLDAVISQVTANQMLFTGKDLPLALQLSAVILLVGLVARGLLHGKSKTTEEAGITISIPDMNCKHCQAAVTKAIQEIPGVTNIEVSLDERVVKVSGDVERSTIEKKIKEAGYNPTESDSPACPI